MSQDRERSRDRSRRERPNRGSDASRDRSPDRGRDRGSTKSSINRVYVSNIPYEFRWQDMKDLFREHVGDVAFVEMFVDENDKPKGVGIVEFSDPASVKKCLDVMQRYEVKGRKLVVKEDSGNMRDKHGNIVGRGGGGDRKSRRDDGGSRFREDRDHRRNGAGSVGVSVDDGKWGNTYGLSPQFLESLHIDAPLSNKVFVANLDYNVDKKKLKEVFRLAGRVVRVEVSLDKDGRSRGFAVVEYDHPVEAVQAISMFHNQVLFDRQMTVRMDRVSDNVKLPEGLKSIGMGLGQNGEPLRNVAYNLPSNSGQSPSLLGAGILGAVPGANALQVAASALQGFNNVSALGNLNPLGAASLTSLTSNLLQNGLGTGTDLQSLMNQNTNLLTQTQQLSALQNAAGTGGNIGNTSGSLNSGLSLNSGSNTNSNQGSYGRSTSDSYNPNAPVTYPTNYGSSARGNSSYGQMDMRNNMMKSVSDNKQFSRKVLISNLPPTAPFKLFQEKLNEFGEVSYWEEKGTGSYLVVYANEWQAERAIKNLDKARIDGRYIEARTYY
ncbi:hypothetical protein ABEB36_004569 [Hypothenemus hampei]|uniref:RRM domain-containing protein n=1 Tax=Hypothenemus hampei TaxID=57062 RepID=A0ABD1F4F1_HYPHA